MGCGLSTLSKVDPPMTDFSNAVTTKSTPQTSGSRNIRVYSPPTDISAPTSGPPPAYSAAEVPASVTSILKTFKVAHTYRSDSVGVKGAFDDVLRHRHIQVWVDDNPNLPRKTRDAIQMITMLLLTLGKAFNSDMDIFFTGHTNKDSNKIGEAKRKRAAALNNLFNTENWDDACAMIQEVPELGHNELQLDKWLNDLERELEQSQWIAKQQPSPYSSNHAGLARSSTPSRDTNPRLTTVAKDEEKHLKMLAKVRDLKTLYWQGWHQRNLDVESFRDRYNEAVDAMVQQPKNLNNSRFTIERAMALQRRLRQQDDANPTTVLIITGSPLVKSEAQAIEMDQAIVSGGADEFSIETLLLCDSLDKPSIEHHRQLDNGAKGDRDLYDMIELSESKLLQFGPSPMLWLKALNSHERAVDHFKFKPGSDRYGNVALAKDENAPMIPSVSQTREELDL